MLRNAKAELYCELEVPHVGVQLGMGEIPITKPQNS
jgi:hypothetical protein